MKDIIKEIAIQEIEDPSRVNITKESMVKLLYYDCPLLIAGRNQDGEYVVISMAEQSNDDGNFFFAAVVGKPDLQDYADEKITLRDLYKRQKVMYICEGRWTTMEKCHAVHPEDIPDSHMPSEDSFFGLDIAEIDSPKEKKSC
jgi:hypothetical protein